MKVAWFGPSPSPRITAPLVAALADMPGGSHRLDTFDASTAHDFVWKHHLEPYDLCIYELADTSQYSFVTAYLFQYPGLLVLHELVDARAAMGGSKIVLTAAASTRPLQQDYPDITVRPLPLGAREILPRDGRRPGDVRFAIVDPDFVELAEHALARARTAGAEGELVRPRIVPDAPGSIDPIETLVRDADVVVALRWPAPGAALADAALGMSAAKPVVVFETEAAAEWPALDPQTWQPRGYGPPAPPIVISIDPRDDEHSLMLAIRRLSADAGLRASLGEAGRAWWRDHATLDAAATAWRMLIAEAVGRPAPPRSPELTDDGTEAVRTLLAPFAVRLDIVDS
jgi:hypothetical protein